MSLLTLIQEAADLLGLVRPTVVITSNDLQVRQLLALAVEEARALAKKHDWQAQLKQQTFTTAATPEQPVAVAEDWRKFIYNSFYNRTTMRPVVGPVTPQVWQQLQAYPQLGRIILGFRQRSGEFLLTPTPPAGQTIAYEYMSNNWAVSDDLATDKPQWTLDTDLTFLDENLITLGIRWRWRKTKGLPYGEDYDTYVQERDELIAADGGNTAINLTPFNDPLGNPTLPEGGFGL